MLDLYKRIWNVTGRAQVLLIILSLVIAGMASLPLYFQKEIVNGLAGSMHRQTLFLLGIAFLAVLLLSRALKFALQYKSSMVSEEVIRLIRTRVYKDRRDDVEQGTLVTMISSEAEGVGGFVGDAIASPLMQLGTLLTVIVFIAWTEPALGLLMILVVAPQAVIVAAMQKRINDRVGYRVKVLYRTTGRIAKEDISAAEKAVLDDFDEIYEARRKIYLFKLSTKFAVNSITGVGTAGILILGGLLVIEGKSDVGSVVAALSGLARISDPWRELIAFYRNLSAVKVKFDLLRMAQQNQGEAS